MSSTLFLAKSPAASLAICLSSTNNNDALLLVCRETEGQKRIYKYIDAVNSLLNSHETYDVIAKAAAEIDLYRKYSSRMAVHLAEGLKARALRCGDVFSEQRIKSIFAEGLPLNVRNNMRMY